MNSSRLTPMGRRIHAGMAASGVSTIADLARRAQVSRQTATRWLYETDAMPSAAEAWRLADALRMSARWITVGDGCPTPRQPLRPDEARLLAGYRQLDEDRRAILHDAAADLLTTL